MLLFEFDELGHELRQVVQVGEIEKVVTNGTSEVARVGHELGQVVQEEDETSGTVDKRTIGNKELLKLIRVKITNAQV